ncbi:PglZ domain-containing protein [Candidatus Poribacteria bacterium]|nr:PglZ domain-containing protein [Candidatus Poribacteria bacterium]
MDLDLLQSYIAFKIPSPRSLLFLMDPSVLLPTSGSISILDRNFDIIYYESDLQIRNVLEQYKDNLRGRRFCIISIKDEDENLFISDYIARSSSIQITPQSLLEFSQKGYQWSEEVNRLKGQDFWENLDRLRSFREKLPNQISPMDCNCLILSALLNTDLCRTLLPTEAIGIQRKLESDEQIFELRKKYPELVKTLEQMVHEAVPLMAKIGQDEDLTKLLWISYSLGLRNDNYELFLPRILGHEIWQNYGHIPLDKAREICEQLIERDPERVIEQIKMVEEWLVQDEERMRIFKDWLGLTGGSIVKAAEFAANEHIFCVPMKDSLRTIARMMVSSPISAAITPQLLEQILKNINQKHIFLGDDTTYMRLRDTFEAFNYLCEFLGLIDEIRKNNWLRSESLRDNLYLWTREIYPKYLSRIELLRDRIETLNFRCDLLSSSLMRKIIDEADDILRSYGESFADLIQKYYSMWLMNIDTQQERPILTTDFISEIFKPLYDKYIQSDESSVYIIVFDGMRWDQWELLKPKILQTFKGKLALDKVIPLISILPSTTEWARSAIFAGDFPVDFHSDDESELLSMALDSENVGKVHTFSESPGKRDRVLGFLDDSSQTKPIIFNLIDLKIHNMTQNLVTLYEEVEVNFNNTIQPYLEKIGSDSLVFILSDHGFVELSGKGIVSPGRDEAEPHRRYIGLKSFEDRRDITGSDFIFFSTENVKMPLVNNILKYGFARPGRFITSVKEQESGRSIRYAHGGVSMQEMIIPCAVFIPKGKGQLTMF